MELIHFYTNKQYLFQTVTSYTDDQLDQVCDSIVDNSSWFFCRFRKNDRHNYLKRRRFVESCLKTEYECRYNKLNRDTPVYFYLIPGMNADIAQQRAESRVNDQETNTRYILIDSAYLADSTQITFTLGDSFGAYWQKAIDNGISCVEELMQSDILEDHNTVFPYSMLGTLNHKYAHLELSFEIQIWDNDVIEKIRNDVALVV